MLTIFAVPKPFRGRIANLQRNAITSWTLLRPTPEIMLFGDEEGTEAVCLELGLRHVPHIARNEFGTPLLNDIFDKADHLATYDRLCYVNADIVLMSDFRDAVAQVSHWPGPVVLAGVRRDVEAAEGGLWDFSRADWEQRLRDLVVREYAKPDERKRALLKLGADYFVFPRGFYRHMPPLVPRFYWDGWLLWDARARGARLVDATPVVFAIHEMHDHSHIHTTGEPPWLAEEAARNLQVAGIHRYWFLREATHILTPAGARRVRGEKLRYWVASAARNLLIYRLGPIRQTLGLRRATLNRVRQWMVGR